MPILTLNLIKYLNFDKNLREWMLDAVRVVV